VEEAAVEVEAAQATPEVEAAVDRTHRRQQEAWLLRTLWTPRVITTTTTTI
jgi:hypothetical protein